LHKVLDKQESNQLTSEVVLKRDRNILESNAPLQA